MKNTFGSLVSITLFGESHGECIGAVIDGLAPGIAVDRGYIENKLSMRRPAGQISTSRVETDDFSIVSGVFEGKTTGAPVCIIIPNTNVRSQDYSRKAARPSHADYPAFVKYNGFEDFRGGGHFSGRLTAAVVAAGALCMSALEKKGIKIATHIKKCASVSDRGFLDLDADFKKLDASGFAVLDDSVKDKMVSEILKAKADGDSVGGVLETAVCGLEAGIGEPWFDSVESVLSHALFSVPAVKGVEFGDGFDIADMRASEANDSLYNDGGVIKTKTNHSGGINGGITNGMPIVFRCAIKPTPTIFKEQDSIDLETKENIKTEQKGRHDPCIVPRAAVVLSSITAIAVCDLLAARFGTNYLGE